MQKKIILFGAFIILLGILWPYLKKIGLGSLPGDIKIMKENYSFFFPITTCILVSVFLSILFWLFKK
jgi:hypothetical protein|tara:strand:- start:483 stop:683 length:201 start_codon:yes stop_codon:yes gene_type:complete